MIFIPPYIVKREEITETFSFKVRTVNKSTNCALRNKNCKEHHYYQLLLTSKTELS